MRTRNVGHKYQITTNGRVVWVNGPDGLLGRFGPSGIDVHDSPNSHTHCLDCRPVAGLKNPWAHFVEAMNRHHAVLLDDTWQPAWSASDDSSGGRPVR